ncbi:hypothetical protein Sta7437_1272 [Stanieria cyanosphaera PCC 7437]|uniref:Glycosyl transferase family 8 n=1 Tax=Stanieria cyanosphaera (strain ATCC 29371 / PCC 7437) TaxID=111780 RepID=K9XT47_STAC7|nr:DUF6492 family protein [Stanieria cyanosphaera]AFZ34842.1 hypothetical protein Sta7437_1272 [Stanieria cyanosphaera PCC 7437]
MKNQTCCIITPSYVKDFDRCRLLSETITQFNQSPINHYIIVDQKDERLFSQLKKANTEIITVESVLPWWIKKIPFLKNGWFSFKTLPLRNWFIQQLVKLSIAKDVAEEVLIFVDSDVAFIRPFDTKNFIVDHQVRLFREPDAIAAGSELSAWSDVACDLLQLPRLPRPVPNYLGNVITWKKDNVFKLHNYIEEISNQEWIKTIAKSWHLSEYLLYGTFVDQVLKEKSGHFYDPVKNCHEYWTPQSMSDQQLQQFFSEVTNDHIAVMISAKAGMPVSRYEKYIKEQKL